MLDAAETFSQVLGSVPAAGVQMAELGVGNEGYNRRIKHLTLQNVLLLKTQPWCSLPIPCAEAVAGAFCTSLEHTTVPP